MNDSELRNTVTAELEWDLKMTSKEIYASANSGAILLRGSVGSWADHDGALNTAWSALGVIDVVDQLEIAYG